MSGVCGCGLIKQSKVGTTVRGDGVEVCNNCQQRVRFDPADIASQASRRVAPDRVTTLSSLPGYRTVRALGVVNALDSASGFTAGSKGNTALSSALTMLYERASELGGNAVLGLVTATFGAGSGCRTGADTRDGLALRVLNI
jgi:uncharacterized protein YbjQ (UPF0145 family)